MAELFLEIGTEEIPAGYIDPALGYLKQELELFFDKNRLKSGRGKTLGTPRRLALSFPGVQARQEDVVESFLGPNVKVAYGPDGKPTPAALGFARGKGVDVSALTVESTPKGDVLCARVEKRGQATQILLCDFLPQLLRNLPFPKKMRWMSRELPFARPMHWIVALFDGQPLKFDFDGIAASNRSEGHRFLRPEAFVVTGIKDYLVQAGEHFIVVDPGERRHRIQVQVEGLAGEVGGRVEADPHLLDEVTHLVEYPVAIRGDFDARYLELPKELLVMTMKHHQRYFPVTAEDGKLLPHFITISNMQADRGRKIKHGNERVLRARLEDARFFFDEDRKEKLEAFNEGLKGVVFQKVLGTSYEKMTRIVSLAGYAAGLVCPEKKEKAERAAGLCKADLVTQMVYEFPELQGIMGGYYALHSGEDPEVAEAIKEHYRPAFAGDAPPSGPVGAVVALADKLDTILGCIGVGLIPSGSEDPYGLRRHALGIIQIVVGYDWQVSLGDLIEKGLEPLRTKIKLSPEEIRSHTLDLFSQRMKTLLGGEDYAYDVIDAVLSTGIDRFVDVRLKVSALADLKRQPHFEPLAIAFRRVVSILTDEGEGEVRPGLLAEPQEKRLFEHYQALKGPVEEKTANREFAGALEKIVEIKSSVDDFFDHVMVMVDDPSLRRNRLCLLRHISGLFAGLADFSKIVVKKS